MKFRDPKTGKVFEDIFGARVAFCVTKSSEECAKRKCEIGFQRNGIEESCTDFCAKYPVKAARLMGYEVIEDNPHDSSGTCGICEDFTPLDSAGYGRCEKSGGVWHSEHKCDIKEDNMEKKNKPRLAEVLGVEEDEEFEVPGAVGVKCRIHDGMLERKANGFDWGMPDVWSVRLCILINHPESIIHAPCLTEKELAICKALGAKWVSRNKVGGNSLHLWNKKPAENDFCYFNGNAVSLATVDEKLFPSVKPGDCICVEEAGGDE